MKVTPDAKVRIFFFFEHCPMALRVAAPIISPPETKKNQADFRTASEKKERKAYANQIRSSKLRFFLLG